MFSQEKNVKISEWEGFKRYDFDIFGTNAIVVEPKKPTEDKKWIFRAEFFGAFACADKQMCELGYYVVYLNKHDMYGHDKAIDEMHRFKNYLCEKYGFFGKTVMFGFSRGGMYTMNYAAKYPCDISAVYLDAPVMNALSWPGGKGKAKCSEREWLEFLEVYGITEGEAINFRNHPIDKTMTLLKNKIPVILVAGCADKTVPYDENGLIFANIYRKNFGTIEVYEKPNCDHHPHSLEDPTPIVNFILRYNK